MNILLESPEKLENNEDKLENDELKEQKSFSNLLKNDLSWLEKNFDLLMNRENLSVKEISLLYFIILDRTNIPLYDVISNLLKNKKVNRTKSLVYLFLLLPFTNKYSMKFALKEFHEAFSDLSMTKEDLDIDDSKLLKSYGIGLMNVFCAVLGEKLAKNEKISIKNKEIEKYVNSAIKNFDSEVKISTKKKERDEKETIKLAALKIKKEILKYLNNNSFSSHSINSLQRELNNNYNN